MDRYNAIILALLEDDIVHRNVVGYLAEELQEQLPNGFHIQERGVRNKNRNYYEVIIPLYNDIVFKEHFRMSTRAIEELAIMIGNVIANPNHVAPLRKKILFTIWVLAKQESYLAAGDRFGFAKSTGHNIVKDIVNTLVQLMPNVIVWPNRQSCRASSIIFEQRSRGFPGVVGAIDGCHITCKAPPHNANDYYNRKGSHSIIFQGVCDHKARFINIYVGLPGRMHDAHVFRCSNLYRQLSNAENPLLPPDLHLIGDAAYPLLQNVMTPFRDTGHLTRAQIVYNMKLAKIRNIIERAFGLLKCKFRRLYFLDVGDFELGQKMIVASCILHNFMINRGEIDVEDNEVNENEIVLNNVDNENENEMDDRNAIVKRNTLMYLFR
ncbi:putative nuclease HARBI1 [Odontomachus brunneus]|uniref:putative nuclease HARBI1 n=1 Tax=Odontomachus brunneus TaxID=486640 RepID=UPI0013F1FED2|nr:putative nuclease HARBI1 [Odontomachus brunneus]XP_032671801.1 putative nuclease HARBI1 [Odontomachus brunneus]